MRELDSRFHGNDKQLPASSLRGKSTGFTLIEAVLMIAIVGGGLIGVMYVMNGGIRSSLLADQTLIASNLAREKLEQIIADRANKGYATTIATNYSDGALSGEYSEFTRTVTLTEVNPDDDSATDDFLNAQSGSGYARVTVTVSWLGGAQSVTLETILANYT
jgi:type II secretory pathway pseudopilin PulG